MLITVELITEAATIQMALIFLGIRSVKNNVRKCQSNFYVESVGKIYLPLSMQVEGTENARISMKRSLYVPKGGGA